MKIPGFRLEKAIASGLKPVYLITGDDIFLCDEAIKLIHHLAKKNGFAETVKWTIQSEDEHESLAALLLSRDLFQANQLILLNFGEKNPSVSQQKILESACSNPDRDKIIVVRCKKLDAKMQRAAWITSVDRQGIIVTIWPLNHEQLKMFITARAKQYRIAINGEAVKLLADFSEGNVVLAAQTIEKASILHEGKLTTSLIEELVSYDNQYTIFDLGDALLMRDAARMLSILTNLQETGVEPTLVLWSLTREVRLLIDYITHQKQGVELKELFKKYNVFEKKQAIIHRQAEHHSLATCYRWLQHAFLIDQKIKKFLIADAWREMQIFCLRS